MNIGKKALLASMALGLLGLSVASLSLAQDRDDYPLILQLTTENGQSYTVNLAFIDCSYEFPYNHACESVPTYTGSAVSTASMNGNAVALPDTGSGSSSGVNSIFDVSDICTYYSKLYSPRCPD